MLEDAFCAFSKKKQEKKLFALWRMNVNIPKMSELCHTEPVCSVIQFWNDEGEE